MQPETTVLSRLLAAAAALAASAPAAQEPVPVDPWLDGTAAYAEPFAFPRWSTLARVPLEPSSLALEADYDGAFAGPGLGLELGAPPPSAGAFDLERAALDAEAEPGLAFEELPGGVVLGLQARPDPPLEGARLALAAEAGPADPVALELRAAGLRYALPRRSAEYLRACLAFALRARAGDVAVDLRDEGSVLLAPELVDTEPGAILVRADRVPHLWIGLVRSKSLLFDREVRLRAERAAGEAAGRAWIETDLEVRFYRPELGPPEPPAAGPAFAEREPDGARRVTRRVVPWAGPAPDPVVHGVLAAELAPAAEVAGWIALFRFAAATDPAGAEALLAELESRAALSPAFHATPRRVDPGLAGPRPAQRPAPVADWMRAHRARVALQAGE